MVDECAVAKMNAAEAAFAPLATQVGTLPASTSVEPSLAKSTRNGLVIRE